MCVGQEDKYFQRWRLGRQSKHMVIEAEGVGKIPQENIVVIKKEESF